MPSIIFTNPSLPRDSFHDEADDINFTIHQPLKAVISLLGKTFKDNSIGFIQPNPNKTINCSLLEDFKFINFTCDLYMEFDYEVLVEFCHVSGCYDTYTKFISNLACGLSMGKKYNDSVFNCFQTNMFLDDDNETGQTMGPDPITFTSYNEMLTERIPDMRYVNAAGIIISNLYDALYETEGNIKILEYFKLCFAENGISCDLVCALFTYILDDPEDENVVAMSVISTLAECVWFASESIKSLTGIQKVDEYKLSHVVLMEFKKLFNSDILDLIFISNINTMYAYHMRREMLKAATFISKIYPSIVKNSKILKIIKSDNVTWKKAMPDSVAVEFVAEIISIIE